jgi:beta-glucosidase/6-phospho-beta-glucosidase/beta-galactosidase
LSSYPHLGAFESIKIHHSGQDVLDTTRHAEFWQRDLEMLAAAGIRELRYPVPWHRIEYGPGVWNWTWLDGPMELMQRLGLRPILDPLHHVSFPDWLHDGFANSAFPRLYARFVTKVAQRYPWADRYTVFNEPLPTLVLCSQMGKWYPYHQSDREFVAMAANATRAICLASAALRKLNADIQLVHIDSCEHHRALDSQAEEWVQHLNDRRFLFHDLALGRLNARHPLTPYLREQGLTDAERAWFEEHAVPFDILGLDYYAHSEMEWGWNSQENLPVHHFPCRHPRGFAEVAGDYVQRYNMPILLSETNVGGTVEDRLTWLKFMEEQSEILSRRADFTGFCWFPSIDATDWCSLCTRADNVTSPMGVWSLEEGSRERRSSELSDWYVRLANGQAKAADLPAYRPLPPLDRDLDGYLQLVPHWDNWLEREPLLCN